MEYREAKRVQTSLLAGVEKRVLIWMAERLPARITSDHLTALGGLAMAGVGICYALAPGRPALLGLAVALLALNWFGDSLDGTVARVRRQERPRYGFYVDHVLDAVGTLFVFGGLMLGGYMSAGIGGGVLVAYYLLNIEIALAAHALGAFRISFWKFGPTELRILLAAGTLQLLRSSSVTVFGRDVLLFDLGGAVAVVGLAGTFIAAAVMNTRALYRAEPLPSREGAGNAPGCRNNPARSSSRAVERPALCGARHARLAAE